MRIGVFAGSFCPVTKGHVDAIEKAAKLVDKLYVVMGVNANKSYSISNQARLEMLSRSINHILNAQAVAFDGIITELLGRRNGFRCWKQGVPSYFQFVSSRAGFAETKLR